MGVLFVEAPLRRLHRVVAFTARFLHHHRLDKLHIFGDSVLLRILLYQWRVSFDLRTDRGIGCAVATAPEQGNGAPKQDDDEDYHDGNPAACDKGRNQRLSPAIIALTAAMVALTVAFVASAVALRWLSLSAPLSGRLWQTLSPFSAPPLRSATWS